MLKADQQKHSLKPVFWAIGIIATLCLGFSYIAEFWADLKPCRLCLVQRYIYAGLFLMTLLGSFLRHKVIISKIMILLSCVGIMFGSFHSLVYLRLINVKCSSQTYTPSDLDSFKSSLTKSVNCSNQLLPFTKIPLPLLNIIIYSACAYIAYKGNSQLHRKTIRSD